MDDPLWNLLAESSCGTNQRTRAMKKTLRWFALLMDFIDLEADPSWTWSPKHLGVFFSFWGWISAIRFQGLCATDIVQLDVLSFLCVLLFERWFQYQRQCLNLSTLRWILLFGSSCCNGARHGTVLDGCEDGRSRCIRAGILQVWSYVRFGGFDIDKEIWTAQIWCGECWWMWKVQKNSVRFSVKLRSTAVLVDPGGCCLPGTGKIRKMVWRMRMIWCQGDGFRVLKHAGRLIQFMACKRYVHHLHGRKTMKDSTVQSSQEHPVFMSVCSSRSSFVAVWTSVKLTMQCWWVHWEKRCEFMDALFPVRYTKIPPENTGNKGNKSSNWGMKGDHFHEPRSQLYAHPKPIMGQGRIHKLWSVWIVARGRTLLLCFTMFSS